MSTLTAGNVTVSCSLSADTSGNLVFQSGGNVTALTIDSSQNVGIGTSSPAVKLDVVGASGIRVRYDTSGSAFVFSQPVASGGDGYIVNQANSNIIFGTNNTERARITSGGYFKASDNGVYNNATASYHEFRNTANSHTVYIKAASASQAVASLLIDADRNTTNGTFFAIEYYNSGAAASKFRVADSGNVTNTNGSYGTISDAKMKTDIVDAGSQWDDIKAIRFRKFKMVDDPEQIVQLGVVAQEIELTSPGLVEEHADKDAEGNDLGTTTKSVKTSVMLVKAAVALQEAMNRIEQLEAKVAALEAA
jgi:hypothetical protein